MKTMSAVRYRGPGEAFVLSAVAIPGPGPGQVRIRVAACGMCHTELHLRDGLLDLGRRDFTIGHEVAGVIDAVGGDVDATRIGERVVVYYYEGCMHCAYCAAGDEHLCPQVAAQPGFISDGGYAEYMVVRARNCVTVPDHVSLTDIAPMGCAGTTAVHAGKLADITPGDWVVVHGAGGVGLAVLQYARHLGGRVIAIGLGAERLALAMSLGAEATIDAAAIADPAAEVMRVTGEGADVVFELVGKESTMRTSVAMLRRRGRLVLIGYSTDEFRVHPIGIIVREAHVIGSVGATLTDLHEIVDLVAKGVVRPLIDRTLPLAAFAEGFAAMEAQSILGRIVLVP
jgi:propanol-preferring alcohol dehydrogenase